MKNKLNIIKSNMKKFEISAEFLGSIFVDVEANSAEEAKEKFLTALGTELNDAGDPSITIENLPVTGTLTLKELNMVFPKEITDEDKKYWGGIEAEEIDKDYDK
jgi:uncharacterized Zn ribbon protein